MMSSFTSHHWEPTASVVVQNRLLGLADQFTDLGLPAFKDRVGLLAREGEVESPAILDVADRAGRPFPY